MKMIKLKSCLVLTLSLFVAVLAGAADSAPSQHYKKAVSDGECTFDPNWIKNPSLPTEVPMTDVSDGKPDSSFCDFYQFSWQTFLKLVSPTATVDDNNLNSYPIEFENQLAYPLLLTEGDSCADAALTNKHAFFLRATKSSDSLAPMTAAGAPERIGQAGGGSVIYDQNGNAAFYEVRFSRELCDLNNVYSQPYFLPNAANPDGKNTIELKMAWKVLKVGDKVYDSNESQYYTVTTPIDGVAGDEEITLGMIGFHIAIATQNHPEMIWVTFDHNTNNPLCDTTTPEERNHILANSKNYSFTSQMCATKIADPGFNLPPGEVCNFNAPQITEKDDPDLINTNNRTEICQVFRNGEFPFPVSDKDNIYRNYLNDTAINQLYEQFNAPEAGSALSKAISANPWVKIWQENYKMIGGIWLTQPAENGGFNPSIDADSQEDASFPTNYGVSQRGSIALANPVMETDFQNYRPEKEGQTNKDGKQVPFQLKNCFSCHKLLPVSTLEDKVLTVTGTQNKLSHIMDNIASGKGLEEQQIPAYDQTPEINATESELFGKVAEVCQQRVCSSGFAGSAKLYTVDKDRFDVLTCGCFVEQQSK